MRSLFGITFKNDVLVYKSLTSIFGLSFFSSFVVCDVLGLGKDLKIGDLSDFQFYRLVKFLEDDIYLINENINYLTCIVGFAKKKDMVKHIDQLIYIGCYKGSRHFFGYPSRGQRTKTNGAKFLRKFR